jgi:RNA polymerase sigma factor (sigma-70 family)
MRTEDGHLISKCLNGEPEAFGVLVDKYKAGIYAFTFSRLRNFHDAEDVTQDVFIKAYQNLSKLRRWDSFAVWVYTIASNLCSKWKRSKSRRPDREFIEDQDEDALENPSLDAYRMDIISNSLHDALDSLPEIYQEALTLHYLGGMSTDDIAKSLGASPTTIRQRLVRARAQLKEEMLVMMSRTFEQQRLKAIFTFRIVEMVKHIRIQPIPLAKGLPWGLSLATGIIVAFLSFGTHLNSLSTIGAFMGSPLPGETKVLKTGEIPVDVLKASNISVISSQRWNGSGLGSVVPSLQNALFMAPQAGDTWTKKADMPTARSGLSTYTVNGKIYAIGGYDQNVLSTVEEYDPKNDTWTKKADMPTERYYLTACAVNGKIYAIGGTVEENAMDISTVEEYDPVADKWTKKADMPTARHWLSASSVNGKIYAIGGLIAGNGHLSTVEEYDPVADKWTRKTDLPRRLHTLSTSVVNDKIYGIGGVDSGVIIPTVYEYDPLVDKWTAKADMPTKRWRVCTSTVNGRIYAIGGLDDLFIVNPNAKALPTVEEYDPDTDKWTKKTDMPMPRADHACSAVGGKIYAFGGWRTDINENIASSVLEYDTGFSGERVDSKGKLPTTWGDVRIASKR